MAERVVPQTALQREIPVRGRRRAARRLLAPDGTGLDRGVRPPTLAATSRLHRVTGGRVRLQPSSPRQRDSRTAAGGGSEIVRRPEKRTQRPAPLILRRAVRVAASRHRATPAIRDGGKAHRREPVGTPLRMSRADRHRRSVRRRRKRVLRAAGGGSARPRAVPQGVIALH